MRYNWVESIFRFAENIEPVLVEYEEEELPNTSKSSRLVSKLWTEYLKSRFPETDVIISSEKYGDYVSEYWEIPHILYDQERKQDPISATEIRSNPLANWEYLPDEVKPYYVYKVCILGTESTGKSTISKKIAEKYDTVYVPEYGRELIDQTENCTYELLEATAKGHAKLIEKKLKIANRLLIIDTDVHITKSYSKYLFGKELVVEEWVDKMNECDLHFYLSNKCPYIQDGTRLGEEQRNVLDQSHQEELKNNRIAYQIINGSWEERFEKICEVIDEKLNS